MSNQDVSSIVMWAEALANKYELGINTVVSVFVEVNRELQDIEKAKAFIENEMKSLGTYRRGVEIDE